MAKKDSIEEPVMQEVNEPQAPYNVSAKKTLRTLTDEEMERSMTLEELDAHLTKIIHQHYYNK